MMWVSAECQCGDISLHNWGLIKNTEGRKMQNTHLYMCGTHMSVLGIETNLVPELAVSACMHLCVLWNVPGLIGRLRNAEYYLPPGEAGLECGPILLSAVTCRFALHTSPGWLHFQFRARFHSFTRTCVLAAGVEASSNMPACVLKIKKISRFPPLIGGLFIASCIIIKLSVYSNLPDFPCLSIPAT